VNEETTKRERRDVDIKTKESDCNLLVSIKGLVLGEASNQIRNEIRERIDVERKRLRAVWIDLTDVSLIDSVGLGVLMGIRATCHRANVRLALVGPSEKVMSIFVALNFTKVFDIIPREEARTRAPGLFEP